MTIDGPTPVGKGENIGPLRTGKRLNSRQLIRLQVLFDSLAAVTFLFDCSLDC